MFQLIAGPCVIESEEMVLAIAAEMKKITDELGIPYTFKASFDKANRTSIKSFRGPGIEKGLEILQKVKDIVLMAGFSSVSITTAENHDEIIAFTSQLAHVVSNAYIKSPLSTKHKGFSAGSYKDLTRVAWLNENMWAQLFLENKKNISNEIERIVTELEKYNNAIKNNDKETLVQLLKDGREYKERCDKFDENN